MERMEHEEKITQVYSLWDNKARDLAAGLASIGKPIGVYNRGVCAIWGDSSSEDFVRAVIDIKGEKRVNRPLGVTLPSDHLLQYIDFDKVPQNLRPIFSDAYELTRRFGSICFIRFPITAEASRKIPRSVISELADGTKIIQNWDPYGHYPTYDLILKMISKGVLFPGVTSMNKSGRPEIIDQEEGVTFSRNHQLPIFLKDPKDTQIARGSYTIISIDSDGVHLERDGNIPGGIVSTLVGEGLNIDKAKRSNFPQHEFPEELMVPDFTPHQSRAAIIFYLQGRTPDEVKDVIQRRYKRKS